jgi:leucyl/phenylalanyl-tRNA--protein transferase
MPLVSALACVVMWGGRAPHSSQLPRVRPDLIGIDGRGAGDRHVSITGRPSTRAPDVECRAADRPRNVGSNAEGWCRVVIGRLAAATRPERLSGLRTKLGRWLRPVLAVAIGSAQGLVERGGDRVGVYVRESPSAAEIAANYTRGWVLFGVRMRGLGGLEWRRFPKRAVITRETAHVPKRLRSIQRRQDLVIRYDQDFEAIVEHCRQGRPGWLTDQAVSAYRSLYERGFIATVGTYRDGRLVGGMWGITVGRVFGLMSMFHLENHAGSLALAAVADCVRDGERWSLIDCGELKDNSKRFGAYEIPSDQFCELVWLSLR